MGDFPANSVGLVETQVAEFSLPAEGLRLEGGGVLPELRVAYETYGRLAPGKDNAVFICHALTGDAHVAGYHRRDDPTSAGWWEEMIGPGKGIDTDHYYVVCANVLGGCRGTTGPGSVDPRTARPYGSAFPPISVGDMVNVHRMLLQRLGVARLAAVLGGSFGGMQVLEWAIRYPDEVDQCICVASAAALAAQALAFDIVGRRAITHDPDWMGGDYYDSGRSPSRGLSLARKIGHITYLSQEMMTRKFGRDRKTSLLSLDEEVERVRAFLSDFEIESYLEHQGMKFVERFDANSYLHITRAMDEYDLFERFGSLEQAFEPIRARMLVVALSSDWLFPREQSLAIANALLRAGKDVSYCLLHAPHGHDAFLVDIEHLSEVIRAFLPWVHTGAEGPAAAAGLPESTRAGRPADSDSVRDDEDRRMLGLVAVGSRVVDLGCGGGRLLSLLAREKKVRGTGVDIDIHNIIEVLDRGHCAFQADIDEGLASIPDGLYDYAILSATLQVVRFPRLVLRELLRVAAQGIVSFPNFGNWAHRLSLFLTGRMPQGGALPYAWYDTPNIHLFTLRDFIQLCGVDGISITDLVCIPACRISALLIHLGFCNLGADSVVVRIAAAARLGGTPYISCRCRESSRFYAAAMEQKKT